MKKPALIIASLAFATGGFAALTAQDASPPQLGRVDPGVISGGTYTADAGHSLVSWRVNHFGFNDYFGLFGDVSGSLTLDPERPGQAKVDVTIPVAKVTTASAGLTDHLLRAGKDGAEPDFFGPEPEAARFVSNTVEISPGGMTAEVTGDLTLNGVTKPVELQVRFTGAGISPMNKRETVGFEAKGTIKRSDFGIEYGLPMVGDDVDLEITTAFEKH